MSFGVADGVGGWVDSGVDPSLFSQALMYHAHRYSKSSWAGEPETDPIQDSEENQQVEGHWRISEFDKTGQVQMAIAIVSVQTHEGSAEDHACHM